MQDNKDNNNVNDIDNKNADNSTDTSTTEKKDEYEKVCYVCHRTESRAGKMINMGNNIYICPDCMQRSFDAIYNSGINYGTEPYIRCTGSASLRSDLLSDSCYDSDLFHGQTGKETA